MGQPLNLACCRSQGQFLIYSSCFLLNILIE